MKLGEKKRIQIWYMRIYKRTKNGTLCSWLLDMHLLGLLLLETQNDIYELPKVQLSNDEAQVKNKRKQYGIQTDGCIMNDHLHVYEYGIKHICYITWQLMNICKSLWDMTN